MLYAYAKLGGCDLGWVRLLGTGLGNLLFPWARSAAASARYGLVPLAPTWFQVKIGPFIRGERDKRHYHDLFRTPPDHVDGWRKLAILAGLPRIGENEFLREPSRERARGVVVFEGLGRYFEDFLGDHDLIRRRLLAMTREHHSKGLSYHFGESISVHVRLGDFAVPTADRTAGAPCVRVPLGWYVQKTRQLREHIGKHLPIFVFSDGSDDELRELLTLPDTRRIGFGSALADLLALSRAHVLVASPGSTFSQWAAYLGRMPVVWYQTSGRRPLYYEDPDAETGSALDEHIPGSFIAHCARVARTQ